MKMTENENKIMYNWNSIDKDKLFALCYGEWEIARVGITMLLVKHLKVWVKEAYNEALQLRPERETFYSLN
jgi:hypothetical protein